MPLHGRASCRVNLYYDIKTSLKISPSSAAEEFIVQEYIASLETANKEMISRQGFQRKQYKGPIKKLYWRTNQAML